MIALVEAWAAHFGYYDGKIKLKQGDLGSFTTPDCRLTAHAPLWQTKPGQEVAVPVATVRMRLAKMQRMAKVARHDMHLALHPNGDALCLYFVVKGRLIFVPFTMMTVPVAFVVQAIETEDGLRISEIHEWRAPNPKAASKVLVNEHNWPTGTPMEPYEGFGAVS